MSGGAAKRTPCHAARRRLLAGLALLPLAGCTKAQEPAQKQREFAPKAKGSRTGLVELITLDPAIRTDIRYATPHNFTGHILYKQPRAFLQAVAAQALLRVLARLKPQGFGLTIYDGYRPFSVTRYMWQVTPKAKRGYVANPKRGSRHNRGCAVDLTLHDLKTGRMAAMPSAYDEFSPRAHQAYLGASPTAIANRAVLRDAMQAEGYYAASNEWWHFDYKDWADYPILDVPFEAL
ncbi:MAG: hypothetical protein RIS52_1784 [Pseudomonadota bacterium]